jgi:hypothetical protein
VFDIRVAYPKYVELPEGGGGGEGGVGGEMNSNIHGPDFLSSSVDRSIFNWSVSLAVGWVPQVGHTHGYTLGTYAIQNERQLAIGESTCSAAFVAAPVSGVDREGRRGRALLHMETLTEIALERCDSARCAILTMGDLATQVIHCYSPYCY